MTSKNSEWNLIVKLLAYHQDFVFKVPRSHQSIVNLFSARWTRRGDCSWQDTHYARVRRRNTGNSRQNCHHARIGELMIYWATCTEVNSVFSLPTVKTVLLKNVCPSVHNSVSCLSIKFYSVSGLKDFVVWTGIPFNLKCLLVLITFWNSKPVCHLHTIQLYSYLVPMIL